MLSIFEPLLQRIADWFEQQIRNAIAANIQIDSAVFIGGFNDSPALRQYLRNRLEMMDCGIKLIFSEK